jgi:predicted transcriptional regulator
MGQAEVEELLKKKKIWMTQRQITEIIGGVTNCRSLNKLVQQGAIIRRQTKDGQHNRYEYKWLR